MPHTVRVPPPHRSKLQRKDDREISVKELLSEEQIQSRATKMDATNLIPVSRVPFSYGSTETTEPGSCEDLSDGSGSGAEDNSENKVEHHRFHRHHHTDSDDEILYSTVRTVHEITVLPVADEHGHLAHYPGEVEHQHDVEKFIQEEKQRDIHPLLGSGIEAVKCLASMAFLCASMYACTAAIVTQQTVGTVRMSVAGRVAYTTIFWALVLWLAEMEGSQSCLVGLQPVDKALYRQSHPHAYRSTRLAHSGDNMERFIVGRQFLIVLVVFVTNLMAFPARGGVSLAGLSDNLTDWLLGSGIAVTACVVMLGQVAQINAANCMLDFINTYFGLFTTCVSIFLDATGLLHSVYLVQILFAKMTGTPIESSEPPRSPVQSAFFWARVAFSCATLGYFCALTLSALYHGETTMWPGVPDSVSVVALVVLLIFVGLLEGMQIALFAVVNLPADEMEKHPKAARSCDLTFSGNNLQAFLVGRQMCVTLCMFVVARITSCDVRADEDNIFGVSDRVESFFNTGLPGAVITTLVGSLAWRIIASSFPVAFLEFPLVHEIIRLCLVVEASGVCTAAWLLALVHKRVMGYQLDDVYIGTPEERAAAAKKAEAVMHV